MALTVGTRLGPYEILGSLGSGGMGEVYRAYDARLDREVAIKVVRERFARDTAAVDRFHREVRAVAALSHPNIVAIHDFGIQNGSCYAVMELLQGHTLGRRLQDGPLAVGDALQIGLGIVQGLEAAHSKGIIHRDIKPENIFLTTSGGVKILDFGLARLKLSGSRSSLKLNEADLDTTESGMIMGTILYMSPEQARSQMVDLRSDLFSFGCVLYEMVTGRRPFQRATSADTLLALLHESPPPLGEFLRPAGFDPLVFRCLEKSPQDRFANTLELAHVLRALIQESSMSETWIRSAPLSSTASTPFPTNNRVVDPASLAVLPFANLGPDRENDYFSDGLSEELINVLSRLNGLHVASRTSSFAYKEKSEDIRKIGTELNVANVLEGSVRKAGNRLRISVRLVSIRDGFLLWSETFDRQLEDIFDIQAEIAQSIAGALQVILSESDKGLLGKEAQADVRAYDFYLRGMQFYHQFRRKGFEFARQMFERAIEIDPKYARAYAGLAYCHSVLYTNWDKDERHVQEADQASLKALELDPSLAEVHAARGMAIMLKGDYEAARVYFENAIKRNPELFEAFFFYARSCLAAGKLEEAAELFEKAHRIRPEDYQASLVGAGVLSGLGRKELAQDWYSRGLHAAEQNLEQHPDDARAYYLGANAWVQLGNQRKAAEWAQRALDIDPDEPLALYNVACVDALQGKVEAAIDCLEKSVANGFRHLAWIEHDSDLDACRQHPRFRALLDTLAPIAAPGAG